MSTRVDVITRLGLMTQLNAMTRVSVMTRACVMTRLDVMTKGAFATGVDGHAVEPRSLPSSTLHAHAEPCSANGQGDGGYVVVKLIRPDQTILRLRVEAPTLVAVRRAVHGCLVRRHTGHRHLN